MSDSTDYPNLDCLDVSDVETYAADDSNPTELRDYAFSKAKAMRARLAGNIASALRWERACEGIYNKLPPAMRW